jgi:hypothetical protein
LPDQDLISELSAQDDLFELLRPESFLPADDGAEPGTDALVDFLSGAASASLQKDITARMISSSDFRSRLNSTRVTLRRIQKLPLYQIQTTELEESDRAAAEAWLRHLASRSSEIDAITSEGLSGQKAGTLREILTETKAALQLIAEQFRMRMAIPNVAIARGASTLSTAFPLDDRGNVAQVTGCRCNAEGDLIVEARLTGPQPAQPVVLCVGPRGSAPPAAAAEPDEDGLAAWFVPGIGNAFQRIDAPFPIDWIELKPLQSAQIIVGDTQIVMASVSTNTVPQPVTLARGDVSEEWTASLPAAACIAYAGYNLELEIELTPGSTQLAARLNITDEGLVPSSLLLPGIFDGATPITWFVRARIVNS